MFIISKIVGGLSEPLTLVLLAVLAGLVLGACRGWERAGRRLILATLALVAVLSVLPLDTMVATALEQRFPPPSVPPDRIDGIIVLGGAIDARVSAARGQISAGGAIGRLLALPGLMARYPEARVVFTGGSGLVTAPDAREAPFARRFLEEIGVDTSRIVFESDSRNTRENALFSRALVAPQPGETWLLVTSAFHMPRSVGVFRAAGWPVVAWPVDYHTTGRMPLEWSDLRFSPSSGLGGLALVAHEGVGLLSYRLMGWSDSAFPAP
jgi:uncharacterized SAM-binding protein YcdF (DUF218 family)